MTTAVLDASAVIALLKGERGESKVAGVLADSAVGIVNHAEIVSYFMQLGVSRKAIGAMLTSLPFRLVEADEALSWEAGGLRAVTSRAGLSLGDRFCLALAKRMDCPAYTADRAWKAVAAEVGVRVVTIR